MNIKKAKTLLFCLILSLSLSSCTNSKNKDNNSQGNIEEEIVSGGEINIPITHVKALNPLLNSSSSIYYFNKLIFESLFEFDKNLEPKEQLVKSYNINPEGSIDIALRQDVLWHDGTKLKASDVKFTIDTIKYALSNNNYIENISDMYKLEGVLDINLISDVVVNDEHNLTIYFTGEFNNILELLTFPIISSQAFNGDYELALQLENYIPIGTGPYKQVEYEKLKAINLEANDKYWGNKPNIEKIKGKILKDEDLSLTSFESGQVDLSFSLGSEWEKYSQDEKVKINEFPSTKYEFLAINSKANVFEGETGKAIKKAIAYGIDRDKIIDRVYLGHATKTNTPVNPKSYLTNKEINNKYKYSVEKARKTLEDAGFSDIDNDTMYEDENGQAITIKLSTNSYNESRVRAIEMIAEDLKSVGINVEKDYEVIDTEGISEEQKQLDWNKFESKINSSNFEIALMGFETSFKQDFSNMFHSNGADNFINYENPELDQAIDNIKNSLNKEEKSKNFINAQEIIIEDLPYISLFFTNGTILSNKKINGEKNPSYVNIYTDMDKWFIPKKYQTDSE